MKILSFSFILFLSTHVLGGDNPVFVNQKDQDKVRLSKIKTQTVIKYQYRFGEPQKIGVKQQRNVYDKKGNLTETILFDEYERTSEIISYEYTNEGRIGSIIYFSSEGDAMIVDTLTYDRKGRLIQESQYDLAGNLLNTEHHRFDAETDKLREIAYYGADGNLIWKTVVDYFRGDKIVKKTIDSDGHVTDTEIDQSIAAGRELNYFRYDTEGNTTFKTTTIFDKSNRKTEQLTYQSDGSVAVKELYSYTKPNIVEYTRKVTGNERYTSKAVVRFQNGRITGKSSLSLFGMESDSESYRYDKNGNLLVWIKYDSLNEPYEMIKYEYEYFTK